ncbi:hypothetical protein [Nocardia jinanensis]|uniref:Uncharacterized protein n=1 Tax=Nocardia jinanensis TaxID=382504 RepID=A0A917VTE3_9NOCA|nr:hypothetical protein [Nocardia jinanensis]GGL16641.1 hypothetical protein GCM10011588_34180 [Nocardia jinanensis]
MKQGRGRVAGIQRHVLVERGEVLAAVLLSIPLLRMADRLHLPPEIDVTAFCAARIEEYCWTRRPVTPLGEKAE